MENIEQLVDMMKDFKGEISVLTGAGISTDSGIPDFRGANGLWKEVDPMEYLSQEALATDPEKFYRYYFDFEDKMADTKPNQAHYALARLEQTGYIKTLITQNIDGLHQEAGSRNVIEVHGTTVYDVCNRCGKHFPKDFLRDEVGKGNYYPECQCGGVIRPAVVLFGDSLSEFQYAQDKVFNSRMLLCVGTSLSVYPVSSLVDSLFIKVAIINNEPTQKDSKATVLIHGDITTTLEELSRKVNYAL